MHAVVVWDVWVESAYQSTCCLESYRRQGYFTHSWCYIKSDRETNWCMTYGLYRCVRIKSSRGECSAACYVQDHTHPLAIIALSEIIHCVDCDLP